VLCAADVRIPGPNASITGALANQRVDSRALWLCSLQATVSLTATVNNGDLLPRDFCTAATLTSQCLRLDAPRGTLTADAS
jgi:hypothetical protein